MKLLILFLLTLFLASFFSISSASCSNFNFPSFATCSNLPVLNSFLHWTYNPSSRTLKVAYQHTVDSSPTWVAWAINPTSKGMVGSQAIIAYPKPDGSMNVHTSPINSYDTKLQQGNLSVPVYDLSASYSNSEITVFATFVLPSNTTSINHVWQDGPLLGTTLGMHGVSPDHLQSTGMLNLSSGQTVTSKGGKNSKIILRNVHGLVCAISWGMLMPIGVMVARYLKAFQPKSSTWFRLHRGLQSFAFLLGIAGWATGLYLGVTSPGVQHKNHMAIGTTIFVLGLFQVFALCLRPKPDHKYRSYWNMYHHIVGYGVLGLSVANIFIGFSILHPGQIWKISYYVTLALLIVSALLLELFSQVKTYMQARKKPNQENIGA
ncbi:cytochrome b561 and DOMON domain-containing protein At4g17280-like [Cornus florida]|uniref:cytochrome b561 and DOMON domain-containing protein At4g17280-like n=1 Tax=Cornus florida TaxID=4283 RepID=UPI0028985FD9|nr:cytochrome b561 and DOMON domain-containing protein At4g17280-like [Cornus florida]